MKPEKNNSRQFVGAIINRPEVRAADSRPCKSGAYSILDVLLFPTMKPEKNN